LRLNGVHDGGVSHGAEVLALGRRRALEARTEEADRELRLGLGHGDADVLRRDGRRGRDIPDFVTEGGSELVGALGVASLVLAVTGPGRFSVDGLLRRTARA
jgi:hypothetical protein